MVDELVWIPLPDGRRLHGRVWRPDGDDRVGVVLGYDPYPSQWLTRGVDASHGRALAAAGIAYARVSIAGSGDSDGLLHDEYLPSELRDGGDVIAWLAAQPWCNGRVGMRGLSWGGFNALQIAALRPPALVAVISACSTDDRYADDVHYMGGSVLGYDMQLWATWAHLFFTAPLDPEVVGDAWRARWLERLEGVEPVLATWLSHQTRDEYWRHGSVGEDPGAIEVPLLLVGGWEDGYRDAIVRLVATRPDRTWTLIGPWGHGWPHRVLPGPHVDWVAREVRWWRHWLAGDENGAAQDPEVELFVQDARRPNERLLHRSGRWITCTHDELEQTRHELHGHGDGVVVSPHPMQGVHAPVWCPDGDRSDFALDQRFEDALSGTIDWEVDCDLPIVGRVVARVAVRADRPGAQVVARLCDVAADGASTLVAMGATRIDGDAEDVVVQMRATGYVVPRGNTLRLAVTPAYWPMLWPDAVPSMLTIDRRRCALDIPVMALASGSAPEPDTAPVEGGEPRRWSEEVFGSTEVRMNRITDSGVVTLDDGSWWRIGDRTMWSTSADPLTSRTTTTATMERGRGEWRVRWDATSTMTADAECFHVQVDVSATSSDDTFFERTYRHDIRRHHG